MFGRKYNLSLNRVHDIVQITEGDEKLRLRVDGDPMRMVAGLSQAQKQLQAINGETPEEDVNKAALMFATVIFGSQQADELMQFYRGDAGCVINVCGRYFEGRLGKLITRAQKKTK